MSKKIRSADESEIDFKMEILASFIRSRLVDGTGPCELGIEISEVLPALSQVIDNGW